MADGSSTRARSGWRRAHRVLVSAVALGALVAAVAAAQPAGAAGGGRLPGESSARPRVGAATEVSQGCRGSNAEVEQAVDDSYVYETWMGCGGIGFARSADGGRTFGRPLLVPGSAGHGSWCIGRACLQTRGWDPTVAVAPDGAVYVSYMTRRRPYMHPVVAVSTDHGASFARVARVMPPARPKVNWADRDFIAVGPDGAIYLTWTYGPSARQIIFGHGRAGVVLQKSADGGRTWRRITPVSATYLGYALAHLLVEPSGRIDVLLWAGHHDYFTSSVDSGRSWSRPVAVQPGAGRIESPPVTWIDTALGVDAAGTLYATWDTQRPCGDIGWLSYSADHGRTWSAARRVTPDHDNAEHLMAVAGGKPGAAYVGWLSDDSPRGFAQYLRSFSVRKGWLSAPIRVSREVGKRAIWPGDTIGISLLSHGFGQPRIMLSWGSAVSGRNSEIWAAQVRHV